MANDLDKHLLATLLAWFASDWAFDQVVFVVGRQDSRQAILLSDFVKQRMAFELLDGRPVRLYSCQ